MAFATVHICSSTNPSSKHNRNSLSLLSTKSHFKSFKSLPSNLVKTPFHPSNPCKLSCSWSPDSTPSSKDGSSTATALFPSGSSYNHWIVTMEKPRDDLSSKPEIIDSYVKTLSRVLGNEKEAQMCIYHASWETDFGFCCDVDEETSKQIAGLPGVLSVRLDANFESAKKDYAIATETKQLGSSFDLLDRLSNINKVPPPESSQLSSEVNSKYWLVRMEKPGVEVVTKPQMVDYYAQTLTKVLGNEKDAQVCIYHISWQNNFGFCCEIDEDVARELAGVLGVLSVQRDANFGSENKEYGGGKSLSDSLDSGDVDQTPNIRTKRLFVTGLSFYTSEKTLRAAFEGFGELVEVKIIMDKISKRSKGYGFIEYTTEEAASAALKEMNGKIINGWMIVVDVAKINPPRYSREQRPGRTI